MIRGSDGTFSQSSFDTPSQKVGHSLPIDKEISDEGTNVVAFCAGLLLAFSSASDFLVIRRRDCNTIIFYSAVSALAFVGEIFCIDYALCAF